MSWNHCFSQRKDEGVFDIRNGTNSKETRGWKMHIQMKTQEVRSLLQDHRQKHIQVFTLQMEGWKKAMEKYAVNLAGWRDGFSNDIFEQTKQETKRPHEPDKPTSYVADYDSMIDFLQYHVGETIELSQYDFDRIVMDEFGWKSEFSSTSLRYKDF